MLKLTPHACTCRRSAASFIQAALLLAGAKEGLTGPGVMVFPAKLLHVGWGELIVVRFLLYV